MADDTNQQPSWVGKKFEDMTPEEQDEYKKSQAAKFTWQPGDLQYVGWEPLTDDEKKLVAALKKEDEKTSNRRIWKIAPGNRGKKEKLWPVFVERGYIGVGWFGCESFIKRDYSAFNSLEEVREAIKKCSNKKVINDDKSIWNFASAMKIGDYVVSNNGHNGVLGIGIIKSNYIGPTESEKLNLDEDEDYFHYRKVDWLITDEITIENNGKMLFLQKTIEELSSEDWAKIKEAYMKKSADYMEIFEKMENMDDSQHQIKQFNVGLSDEEIKKLLSWFVDSSKTYKNWLPKREKAQNLNNKWIQPEIIEKMSYEDLKKHYLDYYNSGTGEKQKLIAIKRDQIIRNEKFRDSLLYLLNEEIPIKKRIDELMDTQNERHIDGMSRALITAFLMDSKPDKYCLWNGKTEMGFEALGWGNLYREHGDSNGDAYLKVLNLLERLKTLGSKFDLSFLAIDLFLHTISAENEGINKLNEIKKMEVKIDPKNFFEYLSNKGYIFKQELVENFLLSLKVKPFVILTGNSGTGKTKLAQLFGQYKNPETMDEYDIIPVGSNWTENRFIVGFYNVITNEYQKTSALNVMLEASKTPSKPYFLILDEMNLSHVERYFSDFLSAMESGEKIPLHQDPNLDFPTEIELPENLFVIGTVNVDETTYMFSPKVLDRANAIEFLTPSARDYMNGKTHENNLNGKIEYLEDPLSDLDIRKAPISRIRELLGDVQTPEGLFWDVASDELFKLQNTLKEAGFDFGFRVINEIMRFMYVSWKYEGEPSNWTNWKRYFDAQIKQKMLPRIHGSQRTLEGVLGKLLNICSAYPSSETKLEEMKDVLYKQRYVAFTN